MRIISVNRNRGILWRRSFYPPESIEAFRTTEGLNVNQTQEPSNYWRATRRPHRDAVTTGADWRSWGQEKFPARRRRRFSSGQRADIFEMVSLNFMLRSIGLLLRPPVAASLQSSATRTRFLDRIELLTRHLKTTFPTRLRITSKNMPARNMPLQADQRNNDSQSSS
jgi:hypothetical protein